jgi:ABC-type transport system involved in cytochrome c biogenesis permease subunit
MYSTIFYNLSSAGYIFSLALFGIHLLKTKNIVLKIALLLVSVSFLTQTFGMLFRWIEAGYLEVGATQKAIGQELSGWSWWVVFSQHPPWSNLYEIMIYMSWGIILVTLICEIKWRVALIRQVGLILALLALGIASLTDSSIKPLVPALKSWWIMIHVISASIAYAFGFMAAFMCFFALLKDEKRVERYKISSYFLVSMAILIFALGGGINLFIKQDYFVKLLAHTGNSLSLVFDLSATNSKAFLVPMPYVGYLLMAIIILHTVSSVVIYVSKKCNIFNIIFINLLLLFICFFVIFFHDFNETNININNINTSHLSLPAPYVISFLSHPWSLGLFILVFILELFIAIFFIRPKFILNLLPGVESLEQASYKAISFSFFLMTIVLITGALWAHYAWGRYWAWDPKETGALTIWLIYAIFLHTRRTSGLSGPVSSLIGVLGFFIIIIGFLGVNLGLFSEGLHSYGNS